METCHHLYRLTSIGGPALKLSNISGYIIQVTIHFCTPSQFIVALRVSQTIRREKRRNTCCSMRDHVIVAGIHSGSVTIRQSERVEEEQCGDTE